MGLDCVSEGWDRCLGYGLRNVERFFKGRVGVFAEY